MRNPTISPLLRDDGIYARVDGLGPPFRFRIGNGNIGQVKHNNPFMWTVEGDVGSYMVQFIFSMVDPKQKLEPMAALQYFFSVEMGFLHERLGVTVDENKAFVLEHPCGIPLIVWISRYPENLNGQQTHTVESASTPQISVQNKATLFTAHAALIHSPEHLLGFAITGFGDSWTENDLQWQAHRLALSYFPLENSSRILRLTEIKHISQVPDDSSDVQEIQE